MLCVLNCIAKAAGRGLEEDSDDDNGDSDLEASTIGPAIATSRRHGMSIFDNEAMWRAQAVRQARAEATRNRLPCPVACWRALQRACAAPRPKAGEALVQAVKPTLYKHTVTCQHAARDRRARLVRRRAELGKEAGRTGSKARAFVLEVEEPCVICIDPFAPEQVWGERRWLENLACYLSACTRGVTAL